MEICEGDIKHTARAIRRAFVERKRQLEPGYSPRSDRHQRIWEIAARICLEVSIGNIEDFVEAQFREVYNPYPNILSNRHQAIQRYKTYKQEVTNKGKAELYVASQMENILGRARSGLDMRRNLCDPLKAICPLIRWTVAKVLRHEDIAAALKADAAEYARKNPDVAEVIRIRFPGVPPCQMA